MRAEGSPSSFTPTPTCPHSGLIQALAFQAPGESVRHVKRDGPIQPTDEGIRWHRTIGGGGFVMPRPISIPPPPMWGRAIAFGKSRVGSETWRHAAFGCRRHALESDCEQTGIETRTAIVPVWRMQFGTASAAQVSSICDSPVPRGGGHRTYGAISLRRPSGPRPRQRHRPSSSADRPRPNPGAPSRRLDPRRQPSRRRQFGRIGRRH